MVRDSQQHASRGLHVISLADNKVLRNKVPLKVASKPHNNKVITKGKNKRAVSKGEGVWRDCWQFEVLKLGR
eukprot:2492034-Amphidinium_carterae.2